MRRTIGLLACTAAVAGLLLAIARVQAADSPLTGNWKLTVLPDGQEINVWLLKVEEKDGKPQMSVVSSMPNFNGTTVEDIRLSDKGAHFVLKANGMAFNVAAYVPAAGKMTDKLLGSLSIRGQREFIRLERTEDKEITPKTAVKRDPGFEKMEKALESADAKERDKILKEFAEKNSDQPAGYAAANAMLKQAEAAGSEENAKAAIELAMKTAASYGPEMKQFAAVNVARTLGQSEKLSALALDYARQAVKQVGEKDPPADQVPVLKLLATALKKAGKADELKPLQERIAKLDDQLDQEFIKNAIPFKPEAFAGRKGKSERVVLLELFTGAQCPPCVAADVAFDALLKAYKPSELVLLQYHLHIPRPDALTNKDSEKRSEFYGVEGTPSNYLDGKQGPPAGGGQSNAKRSFDAIRKQVDEQLETDAKAKLKLAAERTGDQITITADVADLEKPGDNVRLRFVVIEDVVRYPGSNGQRMHHHVVRAFPGGVDGFALKEKAGKQTATINVKELGKSLDEYLTAFDKGGRIFGDDKPLNLKNLKIVALIQDNGTKEVLQAAQVELPEAK